MKPETFEGATPWHPLGCRCETCTPVGPATEPDPFLGALLAFAAGFGVTAAIIWAFFS